MSTPKLSTSQTIATEKNSEDCLCSVGKVRSARVAQGVKQPLWAGAARRLELLRRDAGLAGRDLGTLAAVSHPTISEIERGKRAPLLDTIEKLAVALGVEPCWLAFGEDGPLDWKERRPRSPVPNDLPPVAPAQRELPGAYRRLGDRLIEARTALGLSQRAVARLVAERAADRAFVGSTLEKPLSNQGLKRLEDGTSVPRISTVEALAIALDVSPCWLGFGVGEGPKERSVEKQSATKKRERITKPQPCPTCGR